MCILFLIGTNLETLYALTLLNLIMVMEATNDAKDHIVMTHSQVDLARLLYHLQYANDAESRYAAAAATAECAGAAIAGGVTWRILAEVWKIGRDKAAKDLLTGRLGDRAR